MLKNASEFEAFFISSTLYLPTGFATLLFQCPRWRHVCKFALC